MRTPLKPGELVKLKGWPKIADSYGIGVVIKQTRKTPSRYSVAWPQLRPLARWVSQSRKLIQTMRGQDLTRLVKNSDNLLTENT